jgi:hypothetical protein
MGLTKVFACRLFFQLPDFDTREKNSFSVWHSRQFFESGAQVTFLPDGVPSKKKKKNVKAGAGWSLPLQNLSDRKEPSVFLNKKWFAGRTELKRKEAAEPHVSDVMYIASTCLMVKQPREEENHDSKEEIMTEQIQQRGLRNYASARTLRNSNTRIARMRGVARTKNGVENSLATRLFESQPKSVTRVQLLNKQDKEIRALLSGKPPYRKRRRWMWCAFFAVQQRCPAIAHSWRIVGCLPCKEEIEIAVHICVERKKKHADIPGIQWTTTQKWARRAALGSRSDVSHQKPEASSHSAGAGNECPHTRRRVRAQERKRRRK